jgi:hypothetical protein
MKPAYAEGCRAEARLRDGGRADRVVDPAKVIKSYVATAKERRNIGSDSQKRSRVPVALDAERHASRDVERIRNRCRHAANQRDERNLPTGHARWTRYRRFFGPFTTTSLTCDFATINQKSPVAALGFDMT